MSKNQLFTTVFNKKIFSFLLFLILFFLLCYYFFQYQLLLVKIGFAQDCVGVYKYATDDTVMWSHSEDIAGYRDYVERYYPSNSRLITSGEPLDEIVEKGRIIILTLLKERIEKLKALEIKDSEEKESQNQLTKP